MTSTSRIDLHTHFFGPTFFRVLAAAAHPDGDVEPGLARLKAAGIDVPRGSEAEHGQRWLDEMDRHGIERMVTFASIPEEAPAVADAAAASGGRLIPYCLIDPGTGDAPSRVRTLIRDHGVRGLLLFPAMHRFDLSSADLHPFYRAVEEAGLPVLVHMGVLRVRVRDLLGLSSDFDLEYATPARLRDAARRFPGIRFIIPHFGGGYFKETLALGTEHKNVAVDTSSSNSWIRRQDGSLTLADVMARALDVFGPERIYFGTDSSVFPRGWRFAVHQEQEAALDRLGVSPEVKNRIFRENTLALLKG